MSNILALDQATHISGYCVFQDTILKSYGKITPQSADLGKRFLEIKKTVQDFIEIFKIDKVYFEDIQLQGNVLNNVKTFKMLAQLQGMLITLLEELEIPYEIIHSQVWKSNLGIKGRARKEQKQNAQKYVYEKYQAKVSQDEADAICIATYALNQKPSFDWSS